MKVKDLLNIPRRWIKGQMARLDNGEICAPTDPLAVSFCLMGGVDKCYPAGPAREQAIKRLRAALLLVDGRDDPTAVNDDPKTDHPKIVRITELADI